MVQDALSTLRSSTADGKGAVPQYTAPLELLHPNGVVKQSFVIGSNAPAVLLPAPRMIAGEDTDLVILAPTVTECHTAGWLEAAVWSLARKLGPDGIAYVLAPPPWRARVKRLLRRHGLAIGPSILHLPNRASSRYLVPLSLILTRYACAKVIPLPPWGRRLAMLVLRLPGAQKLLANVLPSAGFVARPPGARPLLAWLFRLDGEGDRSGSAIIRKSWRGQDGGVILHRFLDGDVHPSSIAKMNLTITMAAKCIAEATTLARLGPSAGSAGAQVPQILHLGRMHDHPVLLQTVIGGQPTATLLASRPNRVLDVMECLITWLERWNRSTMTFKPVTHELFTREILAPADLLAPLLDQGKEYRAWLSKRCAAATGVAAPLVAIHNDLTMWNILLDERQQLGIVDWEEAHVEGFPLVDFFYAMTDAVAAAQGYVDRPKAFEACFAHDGAYAYAVRRFLRRLRDAVEIPDAMAELCFHACWLHHAANEHRSGELYASRPFFKIIQWLALHRCHFNTWIRS